MKSFLAAISATLFSSAAARTFTVRTPFRFVTTFRVYLSPGFQCLSLHYLVNISLSHSYYGLS